MSEHIYEDEQKFIEPGDSRGFVPGRLRIGKFSYRYAEQVLNSKLALKEEIEAILTDEIPDLRKL
jgi:hypothetical protein